MSRDCQHPCLVSGFFWPVCVSRSQFQPGSPWFPCNAVASASLGAVVCAADVARASVTIAAAATAEPAASNGQARDRPGHEEARMPTTPAPPPMDAPVPRFHVAAFAAPPVRPVTHPSQPEPPALLSAHMATATARHPSCGRSSGGGGASPLARAADSCCGCCGQMPRARSGQQPRSECGQPAASSVDGSTPKQQACRL